MNRLKQMYSAIIIVLILTSTVQSQGNLQALSFEDARQIMEAKNPALQRAKHQIEQKEYELKVRRGLYMPQLSLSATAVSMSDDLHLDLTPVSDAITPLYSALGNYGVFSGVANPDPATSALMPTLPDELSTQVVREQLLEAGEEVAAGEWDKMIQEKNFASLTADFTWPILTGGKIKGANQVAAVNVEISQEELRETEGSLLSELVTRYYGLALGVQVAKVREQMLDAMENHYSDAEKLFDNGMIAKVELLHSAVSRNEAQRELKQAQRNIEILRSGLAATLVLDSSVVVEPASYLFINKQLQNIQYWVSTAKKNNPQLKQIEAKKQLVDIKNKVDRGSYMPTVAIMGTYNLAEKNLSPYAPEWLAGVGMKWTVFNGMARKNKLKIGASMQDQVVAARQKANADIEAYLIKLYQELQMQMEQKQELEKTLELAQEYSSSTQKAFNEGLATSSSVVDAMTKVAQVKALRLKVLYDYDVALAHFFQVVGVPELFASYCSGENTSTESLTD